jgi:hypothetical protein
MGAGRGIQFARRRRRVLRVRQPRRADLTTVPGAAGFDVLRPARQTQVLRSFGELMI